MSKKGTKSGGFLRSNKMVLICNVIIALCCIASILSYCFGNLYEIKVEFTVNKDLIRSLVKGEKSGGSASNASADIKAAGESEDSMEKILGYIDDDYELKIPFSIELENQAFLGGGFGNGKDAVEKILDKQIDNAFDMIAEQVDGIIEVSMKAVVKFAFDEAKRMIKEALQKYEEQNNVTDEEVWEKLKEKNVTEADVDKVIEEFVNTLKPLMENGDRQPSLDYLNDESDTSILFRLEKVAAEETLKSEREEGATITDEEILVKAREYRDDIVKKYTDVLDSMSVDGEFSVQTLIINLFEKAGLVDEESGAQNASIKGAMVNSDKEIKNLDDLREVLIDFVMEHVDENVANVVGWVLFSIMILFMLPWIYVLIKVIVKTAACRNKTVGLFAPRMFGWMPHVFFVGLPMLAIKYLPQILEKFDVPADQMDMINKILSATTVHIGGMTWISALCAAILTILLFFYWPLRRAAKRERKAKK